MTNTAHWIRQTHLFRKAECQCSACGFLTGKPAAACPRCGAKMKGAKYDPSRVDEMAALDEIFDDKNNGRCSYGMG